MKTNKQTILQGFFKAFKYLLLLTFELMKKYMTFNYFAYLKHYL